MGRHALFLVLTLALGSCAADTAADSSTTTAGTSTTASADTTIATTTTGPQVDVEIIGGEVSGPDRFQFGRGETASIVVVSDSAYELHVHGYDLRYDLEPEVPLTIEFIADVPGIFDVETHPGHLLAFEIEVGG